MISKDLLDELEDAANLLERRAEEELPSMEKSEQYLKNRKSEMAGVALILRRTIKEGRREGP